MVHCSPLCSVVNIPFNSRLVRNDGFESTAKILGTLCSPLIFTSFGYLGVYISRLSVTCLAMFYIIFIVKEDFEAKSKNFSFQKYFIDPLKDTAKTLAKTRPDNKRGLIWLQFLIYALYWMFVDESLMYLYLLDRFEGYDETKYSHYMLYDSILITSAYDLNNNYME